MNLKQEEFKALRTKLLREAREFYCKLEGLLQGHADRDSRLSLGRAYLEVGELTRQLDSVEEALKVHERAVDLFEALSREDLADTQPRYMLARSLQSLWGVLATVGRHDEAHMAIERSRALFRTLAEAEPAARKRQAEWVRIEISYSVSLLETGRIDEAMGTIQRSWPTRRPATWAKRCSWRTPRTPPSATSWSRPSAIWGYVYGSLAAGTTRWWPSSGGGAQRGGRRSPDSHHVPSGLGLD
jgi:tetratricopeptide (TPR) repeat protein